MSAELAISTWWEETRSFGDAFEALSDDVSSLMRVSTAALFFE